MRTNKKETKNLDNEIINLTYKQLQQFHLEAFEQGFQSKNVCGGLGRLDEVNPQLTNITLYKAICKSNKEQE